MTKRIAQSKQALYAAEGGIEWAKACLLVEPELRRGSLALAEGRAEVMIEASGGGYIVTSEGQFGTAVRKIEQIVYLIEGKWVPKSYQELHR